MPQVMVDHEVESRNNLKAMPMTFPIPLIIRKLLTLTY